MFNLFESAPLLIFVIALNYTDSSPGEHWIYTYALAGCAAILTIGYRLFTKQFQNKIFLGINLYFISGLISMLTQQYWLANTYGTMQSAGPLAWVAATGLLALTFSTWFPQDLYEHKQAKQYSFYMTALTFASLALSLTFKGDRLLAEIIPYAALFIAYTQFSTRLQPEPAE